MRGEDDRTEGLRREDKRSEGVKRREGEKGIRNEKRK